MVRKRSFIELSGLTTEWGDGSPQISYRRYRTMEGAANRLQKEAKGYLDSLRGRNAVAPPSPFSIANPGEKRGGGKER